MKDIFLLLIYFGMLVFTGSLIAQSNTGSNLIGAKVLFLDYGTPNNIDGLDITNGLEVAYIRNFNQYLSLALPVKVGVINVNDDVNNRNFVSADLLLHFQYDKGDSFLVPYLLGGAGYVWENDADANLQIPLGLGLDIRLGKNAYINIQGEYRVSQTDNRNNLQGGIGLKYRLGKSDRDGDGIADAADRCPEIPGIAALNGCPDRDNDGIADQEDLCPDAPGKIATRGCPDRDEDGVTDAKDECPDLAGPAAVNGCPDRDVDGIADKDDQCPDEKGVAALNGCPDRDGDGIADRFDKCPDEKGPESSQGCPDQDSDGDGIADADDLCPEEKGPRSTGGCPDRDGDKVADKDDRCPDKAGPYTGCPDTDGDGLMDADDSCPEQAGPTNNKGCPEVKAEDREVLELAMRAVQFETGRARLRQESYEVLDQIVAIMKRYPAYQLSIAGHTDNTGDEQSNQILSEQRAKACQEYMIANGINPARLNFAGYGESRPIASNDRASGRSLNRRVEFQMFIK